MSTAPALEPIRIRTIGQVSTLPWHPRVAAPTTPAPAAEPTPRRLRLVDDFGPEHTDLAALPDPREWTGRIAVALFEAAIGARPATQVMRWLSPAVFDSVVRRSGRAARGGRAVRRPVRLRSVRVSLVGPPDAGIAEACVVLDDHRRVRVMALRLEGLDGRWLVTECEIG